MTLLLFTKAAAVTKSDAFQEVSGDKLMPVPAVINPDPNIIPRNPTQSAAVDAVGQKETRQRHCALRDLCAWLRVAPVPSLHKNITKDLDQTFPPGMFQPSVIFTVIPTGSYSSSLHYIICLHAVLSSQKSDRAKLCHSAAAQCGFNAFTKTWQRRMTSFPLISCCVL